MSSNNKNTTNSNGTCRYNNRNNKQAGRGRGSGRSAGQQYSNLRHHANGTPPRHQEVSEVPSPMPPMSSHQQIHTGLIGTFTSKMASFLTDDELIGEIPKASSTAFANLTRISTFLAHHRAILTLSKAISNNNNGDANSSNAPNIDDNNTDADNNMTTTTPIATTVPTYWEHVIRDFGDTQMDRQAAGLRTNTNRETAGVMNQLVEAHKMALKTAMHHAERGMLSCRTIDEVLSKRNLCEWHKILSHCSISTSLAGGTYRTSPARAGNIVFCPPRSIDHEMECFFSAIRDLHSRWAILSFSNAATTTIDNNDDEDNGSPTGPLQMTYRAVALSAIYLYGISDVHPFSDGNGRISRISCNWVLRRFLGLPFSITLAATPHQRREYIEALRSARSAISFIEADIHNCSNNNNKQHAAIFEPLVNLLLDRTASALQEVQRILVEKTRAASADEEDRIARLVRKRAAAGSCIICLDDNPNIATLCCGHAVHLNCMAEWLSNNATCVSCRGPLPQMIKPVQPATTVTEDNNEDNTSTSWSVEDDDNDSGTTLMIQDEATTSIGGAMEEDTSTTYIIEAEVNVNAETESDEATTSVAPTVGTQPTRRPECNTCRNIPAADCTNGMCGSCCIMKGYFHCERHCGG